MRLRQDAVEFVPRAPPLISKWPEEAGRRPEYQSNDDGSKWTPYSYQPLKSILCLPWSLLGEEASSNIYGKFFTRAYNYCLLLFFKCMGEKLWIINSW